MVGKSKTNPYTYPFSVPNTASFDVYEACLHATEIGEAWLASLRTPPLNTLPHSSAAGEPKNTP